MAFTYVGGATGQSTTAQTSTTVTHGQTINADDLVVVYCNANATNAMSIDAGGGTWTEAADETPSGETAHHALYWKVANGSEPSTYTVNHGSATAQIICKVFRGSAAPSVDAAANTDISTSEGNQNNLYCTALKSQVISANAVSLIFGGKDNRVAGADIYSIVDISYVSAIGDVADQATGGAHRIYTTGKTFGAAEFPIIQADDNNDNMSDLTYSVHISFIESAAGGANPKGVFGMPFNGPFGGPI